MAVKNSNNNNTAMSSSSSSLLSSLSTQMRSVPTLFVSFALLFTLSLAFFFLFFASSPSPSSSLPISQNALLPSPRLRVHVADLPRSLNYGLLEAYWSFDSDSRLGSDDDNRIRSDSDSQTLISEFPPYPESPLIKQYSAEYWILGDLATPPDQRATSFAERVADGGEYDVVFVPFFATISAEIQLGTGKAVFRKKVAGNADYQRQRQVVDFVKNSQAWKLSGGKDHVFVLTDPVAMWHVRSEIASAIFLMVDFGGWWRLDSKSTHGDNSSSDTNIIHHTQVSLLKDVIVPYTHLLPRLLLSENKKRSTLLYFKGAKHRHRGGIVREKLWDLLVDEPGVVIEEGFPNATGRDQSIKGMRSSEFCLHPAGDTPTSCRLFDAIQSLCIPIIVSDIIELPFEGTLDYSEFSIFVAVSNAMRPNWLVAHLKSFSEAQKDGFRRKMAEVQPVFEYDNGRPGGVGPIPGNGAVNHIWRKVHQKLPMIKEAIVREKRKLPGVSVPLRCHCT